MRRRSTLRVIKTGRCRRHKALSPGEFLACPRIGKQIAISAPQREARLIAANLVYIFARTNCRASVVKYRHISKSHSVRVEQRMDKAIIDWTLSAESSGVTRSLQVSTRTYYRPGSNERRITGAETGYKRVSLGASVTRLPPPRAAPPDICRSKFPNCELIRYEARSGLARIRGDEE